MAPAECTSVDKTSTSNYLRNPEQPDAFTPVKFLFIDVLCVKQKCLTATFDVLFVDV